MKYGLTNSAPENLQSFLYIGCDRTKSKHPTPYLARTRSFGGIITGTAPNACSSAGSGLLLSDVHT